MLDIAEPQSSIDPLMKRGLSFHESGQNIAAAKIFEIAYRRDPSAIAAILNMGSSYYKAKHYPEAEDAYKEALRQESENATAHYGLAMIYEEIGDRPAARTQFQKAAELNPTSGKAWLSLAQVTHDETPRLQALHNAVKWARKELNRDGASVENLVEACSYLQEARLYSDARRACEMAMQQDATSKDILSQLVTCNIKLNEYTAAAEACRKMIMTCEPLYKRPIHDSAFVKSATKALIEIQRTLNEAEVPFFLIAGTLLGCIREQGPLACDKDLDIGFMGDMSNKSIIEALRSNIEFTCPLTYSEDSIYLCVSYESTGIDIFRHERRKDYIWCGFSRNPGAMKWRFTPFTLKQNFFFGLPFRTPKDSARYLTETYGDWERPDTGFTSVLSSPARFEVDDEMLRYISYSRLWLAAHRRDADHLDRVFAQTTESVRNDTALYERLLFLNSST